MMEAKTSPPWTATGNEDIEATVATLGHRGILQNSKLALFCSVKCPGTLILHTYDLACRWRDASVTVIGGFHTPMERECLTLLLRGAQPLIICPARAIDGMRMPVEWTSALDAGRLLLLSPFAPEERRVTAVLAARRNAFVASIADAVFVAYADPGGKTEAFCRDVLALGKPLLTLDAANNAGLIAQGARPLQPGDARAVLG